MSERIQPLANAIYGTHPVGWATARLKACMVLLGHWNNGSPRAPITNLPPPKSSGCGTPLPMPDC
ncbi:hypothetical protein [Rhizobium sp. RCAM05973]|uniref:hypothetical protein n=1 Tax=Rhizobium sp. RCAM05973 TaxID=2994066 RepID=UPI0022EBA897|nr:hypothetical protein [Rhizobium sp. RCAM05973]